MLLCIILILSPSGSFMCDNALSETSDSVGNTDESACTFNHIHSMTLCMAQVIKSFNVIYFPRMGGNEIEFLLCVIN